MISKRNIRMELTSAALTLALLVLLNASLCQASSNQTDERVFVDLLKLPDPFEDEKLPVDLPNSTKCYQLMGCFENVPISKPDDPYQIGTEFLFYAKNAPETSVKFELVHNCIKDHSAVDHCLLYPFDLQALKNAPFDPSRRTIIFVSGYLTKPPTDWEISAKEVWLELEEVNVIIVNWHSANQGSYLKAATNTRVISRQITLLLYYLAQLNGLDVTDDSFAEKVYMVGHSLGAHISGFVGMDLGGALGRITGLDPAGPNFDDLSERFRLDRSDAQLVDAIHSNGGAVIFSDRLRYGTGLMSGHIDLYANDGTKQPGCHEVWDIKGCSHGKSNKYYVGFLQHELNMRKHLKEKHSSLYRLNAYISDKFDNFRTAQSLLKYCPKTVHINRDLFSTDLAGCSVPVDFFTWYSDLRDELQSSHGIDFSPESRQNNSFFFFTNAETDKQTDHYLMKAHIAGLVQSRNSFGAETSDQSPIDVLPNECDITFDIKMNSGIDGVLKIERYKMVQQKDHYDVIAPYLANSLKTKLEIAKLDSQDFYLIPNANGSTVISDEKELRKSLLEIFPKSITLSGVHMYEEAAEKRREERESSGLISGIKRIWNQIRGKNNDPQVEEANSISCKLAVNHLAVRPLRLFHRLMVAFYSIKPHDADSSPKVIVLKDDETELPKHSFLEHGLPSTETTKLQLDTVVIGPYDKSFIHLAEDVENIEEEEIVLIDSNNHNGHIAYDIDPLTWIALTLFLLIFIVALAAISWSRVRRVQPVNKQEHSMSLIPTISYPSGLHDQLDSLH